MNNGPEFVKQQLDDAIDFLSFFRSSFVRSPKKDFTRRRKFSFQDAVRFILSFGSQSLWLELANYFSFSSDMPSVPALIQCRHKILPEAFAYLFHDFNSRVDFQPELYHGFRLLAIDGTDLTLNLNENENNAIPESKCSIIHANAIYDVINKVYLDVTIQGARDADERSAAVDLIENLPQQYPVLITADRGYESYNLFAHVEENLFDYVIRIKDTDSSGILSGMDFQEDGEFDITKDVVITRWSSGPRMVNPKKYKYMTKAARFDYIKDSKSPDYEMTIRFVKIEIEDGIYEVLATSLSEENYPTEFLKEIYRLRWGIETSFRELKHVLGLQAFHTEKEHFAKQEIYARLIMYNFSMYIIMSMPKPKKSGKH